MTAVEPGHVAPKRRRRRVEFAPAVPSMLWYLFLFVVPVALVLVDSFGEKGDVPGEIDLSSPNLDQYRAVVDGTFTKVLRQTMRTSITGTLLCLLIGLPVAYFLA